VRSIRSKLLFSFVAVILLPLLTLGVLGPLISARAIEFETRNHIEQIIGQVSRNIDFYIQALEGTISIVTDDPDVRAFFDFSGSEQPYDEARAVRASRVLRSVTEAHSEIAGLLLVNVHERWLSNEIQPITRDPLVDEHWYREALYRSAATSGGTTARTTSCPSSRPWWTRGRA
jgi:two-component system sensor histidine kinase YesM